MRLFIFLFLALPLLELFLLIQVGSEIGAAATVALVILTALAGVFLLRRQGYSTLLRARQKIAQGEMPTEEMLSGVFIAAGGILLLLPGFLTDFLGICCLLSPVRASFVRWFAKRTIARAEFTVQSYKHQSSVIEGEFERDERRNLGHGEKENRPRD